MVDVIYRETNGGITGALKRIMGLKHKAIYVGIQQKDSSRPGEEINNASLLYIHTHGIRRRSMINAMNKIMGRGNPYSVAYQMYIMEHGSPLWHSPPRPVLEPALNYYWPKIAKEYQKIIVAAGNGDQGKFEDAIHRTGLAAQNAVRAWFKNPANGWAPNSEYTKKHKRSKTPLIDTGTLRKAISYVVRDE